MHVTMIVVPVQLHGAKLLPSARPEPHLLHALASAPIFAWSHASDCDAARAVKVTVSSCRVFGAGVVGAVADSDGSVSGDVGAAELAIGGAGIGGGTSDGGGAGGGCGPGPGHS